VVLLVCVTLFAGLSCQACNARSIVHDWGPAYRWRLHSSRHLHAAALLTSNFLRVQQNQAQKRRQWRQDSRGEGACMFHC
jgi:hypothetical protein